MCWNLSYFNSVYLYICELFKRYVIRQRLVTCVYVSVCCFHSCNNPLLNFLILPHLQHPDKASLKNIFTVRRPELVSYTLLSIIIYGPYHQDWLQDNYSPHCAEKKLWIPNCTFSCCFLAIFEVSLIFFEPNEEKNIQNQYLPLLALIQTVDSLYSADELTKT